MQFKLPELGEGVHEGELIKWRVKPGEQVAYDQPLCEIMTDKATVEIPSAFKGKVQEIHAKEGEVVTVGQLMLTFEGAGAAAGASAPAAHAPAPAAHAAPASAPQHAAVTMAETTVASRVPAAPSTRRFAREQGVELATVMATGPNGRVMREDIERMLSGGGSAVAKAPATAKAPAPRVFPAGGEERIPVRGLRKKISEKMRLSKDHAAHFTYVEEADATELVKLRSMAKEIGAKQGVKVTYLPFIMKAMVAALRQYPTLNSVYDEERNEIVVKHYFNIGLSIQTNDGLTAPIVKNVEQKSIIEIARDIQQIVERARLNRLTQDDFKDGTITLTNAGSIGGVLATPIINVPEVAIMGFNKIARKPVVVNVNGKEEIAIRDWTYFSMSLDHRIIDGGVAAEFMNAFIRYVENPSLLLLESY